MMKQTRSFKRGLALLLCLAMVLGLLPVGLLADPIKVNAAETADLDLNHSFEKLDQSGNPTAWKIPKEGVTINTTDKVDGNNALQIDAVAAAKVAQSYAIPVGNANDTYEATFRVKRLSGDSAIYMGIWFGKEPYKNYDNYCCKSVNAKADNEWHEYTVSWGVYKDASYIWLEIGNHSGATVSYLIDNITLKINGEVVKSIKVEESEEPAATEPAATEPTVPLDPSIATELQNGNFEASDTEITNWYAGKYNVTPILAAGEGREGSNAIKFINQGAGLTEFYSDKFVVDASKTYELAVWTRLDAAVAPDTRFNVHVFWYAADGALIDATGVPSINSTNEWSRHSASVTPLEGAVYAAIRFYVSNNGTLVAYVDDVTFTVADSAPSTPADPLDPNFSFEQLNATGAPVNWRVTGGYSIQKPEDAPLGTNVLQLKATGSAELARSQSFTVEPGKTYQLKLMAKSIENAVGFIGIYMTDENGVYIRNACIVSALDGTKTWKIYSVMALAPKEAVSMHIELWCPTGSQGVAQFDRIVLGEYEADLAEPWVPEPYDPPTIEDLTIDTEHPRLFLNAEELATLKTYLDDDEKNIYGTSWKGEFDSLIRQAEAYLVETQMMVAASGGPTILMDAYPVLRDPNDDYYDPIYIEASTKDGQLVEYPHLGYGSLFTGYVQGRMETLALAYLLTGDTRYSDRAISYALQMCDWEWWGDKYWLDTYAPGAKVDASAAWSTQGIAAVYDMCYDELTEEQRAKIETGIIEKGLEWLQYGPTDSIANAHLMIIGGMLTGIAVIINEDNAEQLKPYIDHALTATSNAFGQYAYSGNTEGHYYTGYGLNYFLPGVVHFYRATGLAEFVEHPFLSETLPYWTVMFAAPGTFAHPNYGDGAFAVQMRYPMALISKMMNHPLANYFLVETGTIGSAFLNLIYLNPDPKYTEPENLVAVVDPIGYGVLRTGFADDDLMLTIKANNSILGHNHYDQNAIFFNVAGSNLIADAGHGSYFLADRSFYTMKSHSTILVDGNPQATMGTASTKLVFDSKLYGYIIGSAPNAYGADFDDQILKKFDRHAIQFNHEERAYYIVIDDLLSSKERIYSWQMYNGDRVGFEVDGEMVPELTTVKGNNVSMALGGNELKLSFVDKDGLDMADKIYNEGYTFVASSAATKAHQFMTVISSDTLLGKDYIDFASKLSGTSYDVERNKEGEICWKTSYPAGRDIVKSNSIGTMSTLFFRGGAEGDYIKIPFEIEEDGVYDLTLILGISSGCCQIKTYIDDVSVSEATDCSGLPEASKNIKHKGLELKAGLHYATYEVAGPGLAPDYVPNYFLINIAGMILDKTDIQSANETDEVVVKETYDDENALGALINYAGNLCDLVMFNRTDALVAAGKLSTDGQQASVLGLDNGKITEGFAATKATTLVYDETVLFEAEKALNIVADAEGWHIDTAEAQTVKLNIGAGELISVTVNGEKTDATYENGMITVALDAGQNEVAVDVIPAQPEPVAGDLNGDGELTDADAIYLLYATFDEESYPLNQKTDFNGDGEVTDADAIYLLYATFDPDGYPLK